MPKTTPRPIESEIENKESAKKSNGYERPTFVRCELSTEQKREMAEWATQRNADDLLDCITQSISDGYTVSFKTADVGYQASLTQSRTSGGFIPNAGKSLVTRASTPERAIWSLYYKHTQVLDKDWSGGQTEQSLEW